MSAFTDKAKSIIAAVAPTLGTALGGPFGALAGSVLSTALGGASTDVETAVLSGNPDALIKLKQAEIDFKAKMKELEISEEKLVYDDRANARAREIAVKDTTPRNLAYLFTTGFFAMLAGQFTIVISHVQIDPTALRLLDTSTGVLFAMMLGCKEYYFGSSSGSEKKSEVIAKIAQSD